MSVHRRIEDGLAILGGALAAAYVLGVEVLPHVAYALGNGKEPVGHAFPWGVALVVFALVLPKTVGRSTAGAVWTAVAAKLGGKPGPDAP